MQYQSSHPTVQRRSFRFSLKIFGFFNICCDTSLLLMIVYQIMKNGQNENTYSRAILQTASMSPNGISDFGITGYVPNNNHVYATTTSVEKM